MGSQRVAQTEREYARNAQRPDRRADKASRSKSAPNPTERDTQEAIVAAPQRYHQEVARTFYSVMHADGNNAGQPANFIFDFIHMVPYFSEQSKTPLATANVESLFNGMRFDVTDPEFAGSYVVSFRPENKIADYASVRTR